MAGRDSLFQDAHRKLAAAIAEAERVGMRDDHDLLRETFRVGPNALALTVAEARALRSSLHRRCAR